LILKIIISTGCVSGVVLAEVYFIRRAVRMRRDGMGGFGKLSLRLAVAQLYSAAVLFVFFLGLPGTAGSVLCGYAIIDLKTHDDMTGVISDDAEIIEYLKSTDSPVHLYDASGPEGVVLAKRDLLSKEKLTEYEATVLPIAAMLMSSDEEKMHLVPETNSLVYTKFIPGKTEPLLIELALSYVRLNSSSAAKLAYSDNGLPKIDYVRDEEYVQYVKIKKEQSQNEYQEILRSDIKYNEQIRKDCAVINADNVRIIRDGEADYQKNCTVQQNYSNCAEFKAEIEENIRISKEAKASCTENDTVLDSQYEQLESEIKNGGEVDLLSDNQDELSAGMYFPDFERVVMKVIESERSFFYVEVLLHELFHHYSGGGPDLPVFINEGITEYLTYKSLGVTDYGIAEKAGYFKEAQIIMALLEKIPEEELLSVYFGATETSFEELFSRYFEGVEYDEFVRMGDTIFMSTYEVDSGLEENWLDLEVDHPHVGAVRELMGLERLKFYIF
jgi:hypothetical protein